MRPQNWNHYCGQVNEYDIWNGGFDLYRLIVRINLNRVIVYTTFNL